MPGLQAHHFKIILWCHLSQALPRKRRHVGNSHHNASIYILIPHTFSVCLDGLHANLWLVGEEDKNLHCSRYFSQRLLQHTSTKPFSSGRKGRQQSCALEIPVLLGPRLEVPRWSSHPAWDHQSIYLGRSLSSCCGPPEKHATSLIAGSQASLAGKRSLPGSPDPCVRSPPAPLNTRGRGASPCRSW